MIILIIISKRLRNSGRDLYNELRIVTGLIFSIHGHSNRVT